MNEIVTLTPAAASPTGSILVVVAHPDDDTLDE